MNHRIFDDHYEDIIGLAHHVSPTRPRMSMRDRAAQFSAFRALTGYEDAVYETARLTDERIELDENQKAVLNEKLQILSEFISEMPEVTFIYFCPDGQKEGGSYEEAFGSMKKIDEYENTVIMTDGRKIPIEQIFEIRSEIFGKILGS